MVNRTFTPTGTKMKEPCNFRVIASTTKDLGALSGKRKFQKDLLSGLKGICIHLPPLRRFQGDIIKMALYYLDQHCRTYKIDTKGISPECLDILTSYKWPGNIAELAGAMDKAVASAKKEPTLYSIHLPSYIRAKTIKKIWMPDSFFLNQGNRQPAVHKKQDRRIRSFFLKGCIQGLLKTAEGPDKQF